jgi:hypothetical protein
MEAAPQTEVLQIGALEIRPAEGLVQAGDRALTLSVREFGLLVALARRAGRIVRREDLYALGVGVVAARGRPLDRRLRPQAAGEARGRAAGVAVHPHPRGVRLSVLARAFTRLSQPGDHVRNKL